MRKISYIPFVALAVLIIAGCSTGGNGELIGVQQKPWFEPNPYGMQLIPLGSFNMGPNDQSANWAFNSQNKTVSVESFWMDETEITNSEYKQFIGWVRDSLSRLYIYKNQIGTDPNGYAAVDKSGAVVFLDEPNNIPRLNWDKKFDRRDEDVQTALDTLFNYNYNPIMGKQLKSSSFLYTYYWIDYKQASLKENKFNPLTGSYKRDISALTSGKTKDSSEVMVRKDVSVINDDGSFNNISYYKPLTDRNDFIMQRTINIYPDTLCWIRDFTYAYNEPYMKMYFSHPGYADYPLVGITWEQATAFCNWRTKLKNNFQSEHGEPPVQDYRLPMESEWEYAARGGRSSAMYPWGGPYSRKSNGCFLANFKPQRGTYTDDGFLITSRVASYPPNDYGLYDMAGNVSEWTSSTFTESSMSFINELNPNFQYNARPNDPDIMKRKVVRGGSWKDIAYFMQCGVSTYEYQNESKANIGFRCVRSFIGPE